jgi:adenylate cyclase
LALPEDRCRPRSPRPRRICAISQLAETRLPYDVVFILNRYFLEMSEAVENAGGYVDKFIGDGVMALFGLDVSVAQASSQALTAVGLMSTRLDELNRALADDLDGRLRIGIGVHAGPAIVGEMGYGRVRSLTAIGDTVNIASRLQSLSKNHACELVVSEELLLSGGLDLPDAPRYEIEIRGRRSHIAIRIVTRICDLRVTTLAAPIMSTPAETADETDNRAGRRTGELDAPG